jgi:AcrR family transcriptional regulator
MSSANRPPGCGACDPGALSERARARREAILAAGRELFLEKGYSATSLADVVKRSGGSLATVYELFGNKRGLFEAILVGYAEEILSPLCTEGVAPDPERGLAAVGHRYLESILCPTAVAWFRVVIQEAPHVPELRETFFCADGAPVERALAGYLAELARQGKLSVDDPLVAAGQFLDLLRGGLHRRALAGDNAAPTAAEIDRQVTSAVRLFLHGCGRRPLVAAKSPSSRSHRNPTGARRVSRAAARPRRSK